VKKGKITKIDSILDSNVDCKRVGLPKTDKESQVSVSC